MKRRILSIITALALCLSLCPTWALAAEADPSLCKHHPAHTEDCGYTAPTEGHDCGHEHTEDCFTADEAGGEVLDCHHSHNSECGYVQADPGQPCGYVCRICPIEALIAALPEQVTEDNAADVRAQLDRILDLYRELNEGEQEEIDLSHVTALQGALDAANAPMTADGSTEQQDTDEASVTINGETLYYATLEEAFAAANRQTATITMLNDAEYVHSDSNGSPLNINGGNVTLNLNGKTLSGKGYGGYGIIDVSGGSLLVQGEEGNVNVTRTGLSCRESGKLTVECITLNLVGDSLLANAGVTNQGGTVILNGTKMTGGASNGQIYQYSGTTTINDVTATGTTDSAPKSVWYHNEGTLTINGGTFNKITVDSDNCGGVTSVAELLGEGYTYRKQGGTWATDDELAAMEILNVTVEKIPLTINPKGDTSWYYNTQQTHTLAMNAAPVDSGTVTYVWKNGTETLGCTLDTYTVPAGTPVGSYTYTCEATCDGYTLSHTFTFEIKQSGTQFVGDGVVKTFNGSEETTSFSAGDTITVKATPTPTGDAPQKAAARLRGEPGTGQMALYVGDALVSSEAANADTDGSYTMTVSAADVLLAAGGPGTGITLTAKFVENDNMADGAGTATVNITAVAKAERGGNVIDYFGVSNFEGKNNLFCQNDYADATITLLGDVQPGTNSDAGTTCSTMVNITCTLDLAGHNFTSTDTAIYVLPMGNLTIQDSSTGKTGNVSFIKSDGTLTLYGGTFGKIETAYTLSSLLAENCAYYRGSTPILLSELEGQKTLDGTVTVQECQHKDVTPTSNNDGTHTLRCPYCGYTKAAEDCDYGEYTHNDTSHTRICKLCGYQNVEAHNIKCTAEASGTVIAVSEACKTCGYGKDLGIVTIHIPKLVYGDLTGVITAETTLTETVVVDAWVDNNPSGVTVIFPFDPPTMATLTGNALLSAGEHKIKINIVIIRDENALAECELTFNVDPAPLTADMVTLGQTDVTYNGTEQKPALSVKQGETPLTEGTDYEVSYTRDGVVTNDFTSAGTVNITVTGKGNYTGSVEKTYTIGKATPTIKWEPWEVTVTYTGQPADVKPVITLVNGENYTGEIHYSWLGVADSLILPTDAGSYGGVKASIPEQNNYNTAITQISLTLCIDPADQTAPAAPTADEENIKDTSITLNTIENAEYKRDDGEWQENPTFTGLEPNQAYTFYARLKADRNHNASTSSAGTSITTRKAMLENASVTITGTYTYTGAAIVPEAGNVEVVLNGTKIDSDQYTISASNNINAGVGKATLTVTATETGNYSGSVSSTFTIAPATLTIKANDQTITYGGSIATGTDQVTPAGLVGGDTLESVTLEASSDQVAVADKTITPSAAVIKRGGEDAAANYNITYQPGALTINKAQAAVTGNPTANTLTYTGAAQALVTAGTASVGEVVYSLTETGTYSTTIPTGTNAGSYTVWYKVEGTTNYEGTDPVKVDVTIAKVNYTGEKAGSTSGKFGMTKTYDLKNLLPEGYVLGIITTTDTNSIFEVTPTVSGTVLTYKLADSAEAGKTGTITIPVTESTNYNSFDLTITVTVTNVRIPDLTVNPISVTYTGNPVNSNQITGTATVDGNTVLGTWSFAEGQALTNVADSGPKSVVFNPTDTDEYGPATGTVTVTIRKATPSLTLTPSPATLPNGGTVTLTLSGLPGGSATVTCSDTSITVAKGSGNTWTADLPAGGASYTFTASYAGDGNHNSASASCTVSVEKITPRLSLTAAPAALRGGGAVTLTLSGLPAGGTATVSCSSGITVTAGAGSTWTATLPNSTATYTFTASYAGSASYNAASASCTVETSEVTVLPNPPAAEDGKQYQVVMEDGISEVPAGLQSIETLNTPEKLETAMKTAITQANSGVPQDNTAVYDVELQISTDGGATWTKATAANFPANGLTVTLPYPAGTNSNYTFTVVHMFTTSDFNKTPGDTETPRVTNTASGLQFTVSGLSPISVGWEQPKTPVTPPTPSGGGGGGGGGWSSSTYAVTVERAEHGKVTSNRTNASSGSTVTLTATPDSGYVLDTLTVTDSRGNEIRLTAQGGGKYTFTMPSRAVTVKATFAPLPEDTEKPCDGGVDCPSHGFTDLGTVGTWYHEAVDYVLRNNLMGGYGNGLFGPNDTLTRAQFAQILYNKEGRPAVTGGGIFTDVAPGAWCAPAVTWAAERGIVGGYGNGMFGPNDNITREQLAVMLWRYAGSPAATDKELHFTDADKASGYALDALRWAVENSIINGKGGGILDPKGLATRAQAAQMLKNFLKDE